MATPEQIEEQLERYLSEFSPRRISDGVLVVDAGTGSCAVFVSKKTDDDFIVVFEAPVVLDAPLSKELVDYCIISNQEPNLFTNVLMIEGTTAILALRYSIRGKDLRKDDVTHGARLLAEVADLINEAVQARFGGTRPIDYNA